MAATGFRSLPKLAVVAVIVIILYTFHSSPFTDTPSSGRFTHEGVLSEKGGLERANATLGFGAIVVVSRQKSTRRHALLQAANVTELDLTIPLQPVWTEKDVNNFKQPKSKLNDGSVKAWLGHRNALQWFLKSGLESAVILEDDVDWDIRLRSVQIPLAAKAVRKLAASENYTTDEPTYWAGQSFWDLLYVGHCGDYFDTVYNGYKKGRQNPSDLTSRSHLIYDDETTLGYKDLHPWTEMLFQDIEVPEHKRVIYRSEFPLCTFAYAVTRSSARRLLDQFAPAKEGTSEEFPTAFDIAIMHACRWRGEQGERFKCLTVNPELFHHMPGKSEIATVTKEKNNQILGDPPVDRAGKKQVEMRNETSNINCGFWGGAFSFPDEDQKKLSYLQQKVGREGLCLKKGRKSEA